MRTHSDANFSSLFLPPGTLYRRRDPYSSAFVGKSQTSSLQSQTSSSRLINSCGVPGAGDVRSRRSFSMVRNGYGENPSLLS